MKAARMRVLAVFVVILPLIADQMIKYAILNGIFALKVQQNYGFLGSIPAPYWLTLATTLIFTLILAYFWLKNIKKTNYYTTIIGLSLMLAGALSNLTDRLVLGYIIDYFRALTAVFNIADISIVLGLLIILIRTNTKTANY